MSTDNHLPKDNSSVPGRTNDLETFAKFASVKSYQDYLTDKDNPVVMVTLTVNDQGFLDNTTFETYLAQHTNAHDEFTIVVSDTAIDDFYGQVMRNSKNLLGEPITIHIHHKGAVVQSFKGIIAQVSDKRNEGGGYGNLHISGYGLSILLDSGEECQSYEDKTLPEIIAEATNEYGDVKVNTKGMVNTKYKIPYVVQYKESDYQFIQRLARRYGEFFFYDGTQLQFNNETRQTVRLSEGDDLIEVAFELKIQPQHFSYLSYGVEKGEVEEKNTKNVRLQDKGNPFQFAAVKASEKVFTKKTKVPYNAFTEEFRGDYLADNVRREKESREQLMEIRGRSRNPNLRIGGFVKLKDINEKPMESYRIIDIKHHQSGYDYENEFVAIPDVYIAYYYDREALPRAEQQIARVTDNNDPKGLGRVRVQFIWQVAKKLQTPWIRVVQPHAGGGKGFYFIPEIGEEVWVDFEDQNAERPFVVGSNYNGKEYSPFHNTNNDIKAIQTRSGHKLIFTEDESILLSDKNGNTLRFDTQGKNIEISAPESISLCAGKDINLSAGNNLLMDVANVASFNILQQLLVNTPYMKQLVTELFHTQAGKALINSNDQIKIEAKETNVAGIEKLLVHSDRNATLNSRGVLSVKGEQGNKYSNKADSYQQEDYEGEIDVKCLVHFRPKKDWGGVGYGFDWMREEHLGDIPYKKIVQKLYKEYEELETDKNVYEAGSFLNDDPRSLDMFKCLKSEYGVYKTPLAFEEEEIDVHKEYYASWISTYPDTPCTLSLLLELEDPAIEKVYLVPPKGVQVTPTEIPITSFVLKKNIEDKNQNKSKILKYRELIDGVTITVTGEGDTPEKKANSLKHDKSLIAEVEVEGKRHLVGKLKIWRNAPEFQKTIQVTLVMVSTQLVNEEELNDAKGKAISYFKKYLSQALVQVEVKEDFLDLSDDTSFREQYLTDEFIKAYYKNALTKEEQKNVGVFLKNKCQEEETFYKEHYVAFYFYQNEGFSMKKEEVKEGEDKKIIEKVGDPLGGYHSPSENILILFSDMSEVAPTHELCHMIGLDHSFANRECSNNEYTFRYGQTDNIMDYFSLRFSLWKWQWEFIYIQGNFKQIKTN